MEKEILFRGKITSNREWVYGFFVAKGGKHQIVNNDNVFPIQVIPETVGQFINQTDMDEVKIFEGDRLQVAGSITYTIVFLTEDEYGEKISSWGLKKDNGEYFAIDHFAIKNGKVISNIHDEQ